MAGDSRITPFGAVLRHYKIDELPGLWDVLIGNMSFVGPRPDVPGYADKVEGDDRDVLKLRPGITGPATLKYRLEDEMISDYVAKRQAEGDKRPMQEIATEYNDKVIYPDKVHINCYYYRNYSFWRKSLRKKVLRHAQDKTLFYRKNLVNEFVNQLTLS